MAIHLYEDAGLIEQISEGDFSNPDDDSYNGTDGDSKDKQIYLANEWTTLAADVALGETSIEVAEARFANGEIIIIDDEQMQVLTGEGTTTLGVERGYGGTTPATHTTGTTVYSGYNYAGITVQPIDLVGANEDFWYTLALSQEDLDTATPAALLNLGDKAYDQTLSFWRRCTVPAGTPVQNKTDIKLRIAATENPIL